MIDHSQAPPELPADLPANAYEVEHSSALTYDQVRALEHFETPGCISMSAVYERINQSQLTVYNSDELKTITELS